MSASRESILGTLKRALEASGAAGARDVEGVKRRLAEHRANLIPTRGAGDREARADLFTREAEAVNVTVTRVATLAEVPAEVGRYLSANNLPAAVRAAPSLDAVPWAGQPTLDVQGGPVDPTDTAGISRAFGGVAETGTLVFLSGPENPTTLNYVPPTHIAVLGVDDIDGDYESIWTKIRACDPGQGADGGFMPRAVNWITGPSRSADIEQTLLLGAHGPQRLHIVLVDDTAG